MHKCTTVKKGVQCPLMTEKGCGYNGATCYPVMEQCSGCAKQKTYEDISYCNISPEPAVKWKLASCNFASHVDRKREEAVQKINPLKASKRAAAAKK